jgi:hypothetical protein
LPTCVGNYSIKAVLRWPKNAHKLNGLQFEKAFSTLTKYSSTIDPPFILTAMKTTTSFHYSNYPVRIAQTENTTIEKKVEMRLGLNTDVRNQRFAVIENNQIQDPSNWDASWFGNYE